MTAQYIQDCSTNSPLLEHYAKREYNWMNAGKEVKRAIAETGVGGWFPFTMKNLNNKTYFTVQRFRYNGQLYAAVTNSAINYLFAIHQ